MASLPDYFDKLAEMSEKGEAFESFVVQLFQRHYPGLRGFPPGKDGGVDLLHVAADRLTAFQAKAIGGEPKAAWEQGIQVLRNSYERGKPQEQTRIWERKDPPIRRYVLCVSCRFKHAQERQGLVADIRATFASLAKQAPLAHLAEIEVEVFDRDELRQLLDQQPNLAMIYNGVLSGFELLDHPKTKATGLRRFLLPDQLPYLSLEVFKQATGRQGMDETSLLAQLAQSERSGLIIHGVGGIGKTRLALELGRRARAQGRIVLQVTKFGETQRKWLLELLVRHDVLLILDYVETLPGFDELLITLDDIAETSETRLRYVATCRGFFYQHRLQTESVNRLSLNCNPAAPHKDYWDAYRRAVVHHIQGKIEGAEAGALFDENPVVAVFLADPAHRARLAKITDVQGAETLKSTAWLDHQLKRWLVAIAQQTAGPCDRQRLLECLAACYALVPLPQADYESAADPLTRTVLAQLRDDGWLEIQAEPEGRFYQGPHDFIADMILAAYLVEARMGEERRGRLKQLLVQADRWQAQERLVDALVRVRQDVREDWAGFWRMAQKQGEPRPSQFWQKLLAAPLLNDDEKLRWLSSESAFWQEQLNTSSGAPLLARLLSRDTACLGPDPHEVQRLVAFVLARDRHSGLLATAFDLWPKCFAEAVFDHLKLQPREPDGQLFLHLFRSDVHVDRYGACFFEWCKLPSAVYWLRRLLREQPNHAHVRAGALEWLKRHGTHERADFVFRSWLNSGGDLLAVKDQINIWLKLYDSAASAGFVFRAWLDRGGDPALVKEPIARWLKRHATAVEAGFVYTAWLDGGGEPELVKDAIAAWLEDHAKAAQADFVYKAWLGGGGDLELVERPIAAWLEDHAKAAQADFVYKAWLGGGGDLELVEGPIAAWLEDHAKAAEAQFIYKAWLDKGGEQALVKDAIAAWLEDHAKAAEAQFVYKAWLDRGGEKALVKEAIAAWLEDHAKAAEAQFVYKAWLDRGGEPEQVIESIAAWLSKHGSSDAASFVLAPMIQAGVDSSLVWKWVDLWLSENMSSKNSRYVIEALVVHFPDFSQIQSLFSAWVSANDPDEALAPTFLRRRLNACGDAVSVWQWISTDMHRLNKMNWLLLWLEADGPLDQPLMNRLDAFLDSLAPQELLLLSKNPNLHEAVNTRLINQLEAIDPVKRVNFLASQWLAREHPLAPVHARLRAWLLEVDQVFFGSGNMILRRCHDEGLSLSEYRQDAIHYVEHNEMDQKTGGALWLLLALGEELNQEHVRQWFGVAKNLNAPIALPLAQAWIARGHDPDLILVPIESALSQVDEIPKNTQKLLHFVKEARRAYHGGAHTGCD